MNTLTEAQRHQVKFFIKKFEAIPEEKWCVNELENEDGQRCALGHTMALGGRLNLFQTPTEETIILQNLFKEECGFQIAHINNGMDRRYQQPTPKQRVLNALYDKLKP